MANSIYQDHASDDVAKKEQTHTLDFTLEPDDNLRLAALCGQCDETIREIELRSETSILNRGNQFRVQAAKKSNAETAKMILESLYRDTSRFETLSLKRVHLTIEQALSQGKGTADNSEEPTDSAEKKATSKPKMVINHTLKLRNKVVEARTPNQKKLLTCIQNNPVSFAVGPAGTGKTYLAVAAAVRAFENKEIERIVLTRPAVEAGERLGFLPGDLNQKIDPYLRPLYDALYELMGPEQVTKLLEREVIELAPLAYMRGRTLNDAFVLLDEAQNTTAEQMKMFLTRIGFRTKAVITGDASQVDLPRGTRSGLVEATQVLKGVEGICFTEFDDVDVVRHPVVRRIVRAYNRYQSDN